MRRIVKDEMKKKKPVKTDRLYGEIRTVLEQARTSACRAVNFAMVQAYWQIGSFYLSFSKQDALRLKFRKKRRRTALSQVFKMWRSGSQIRTL